MNQDKDQPIKAKSVNFGVKAKIQPNSTIHKSIIRNN